MTDHIQTAVEARIMTIRFNRPEKKNAITAAMYEAMIAALSEAQAQPQVRAAVFCAEGDCFTSGHDLQDFLEQPLDPEHSPVVRFLRQLANFEKPLLAAVNGAAIGIGTTLLLHCDLVYAAAAASFQLPFTRLALVPEAASSLLLPRMVGPRLAAEMLLLGRILDAPTALRHGLLNEMCEHGVLEHTLARAQALAALPPAAVRTTKRLLKRPLQEQILETMREENQAFGLQLHSAEAREAMQAFLQRRAADFSRFD